MKQATIAFFLILTSVAAIVLVNGVFIVDETEQGGHHPVWRTRETTGFGTGDSLENSVYSGSEPF